MGNENAEDRHLSEQSCADWVTRIEFARMARVDISTTKRWARRGIGPRPRRLGPRLIRYDRNEVLAYLREGEPAKESA